MITVNNLTEALSEMGFTAQPDDHSWVVEFDSFDATVEVNFARKRISYPVEQGMRVNDRTTCNFDHPENFVVLECVCRLLAKGYRPDSIELERKWTMGHDPKGGKADIVIGTDDGSDTLCIIECKTAGTEYRRARQQLFQDGGQLFSYWQQDLGAQWLVLYASDLVEGHLVSEMESINAIDDNNVVELARHDDTIKLYARANNIEDRFEVWDETYEKATYGDVLFSEDTSAYHIGTRLIHKKDLVDFGPDNRIVNQFEEILRHNNVSDKENAFNRLIALFLCKLVDESERGEDDVMEFQYRPGTDTYESLQNRLQHLHQKGLERFMQEKTTYVPDDYVERALVQYGGEGRKRLIAELNHTLNMLKFYTNNDFSFKDVHNEELFLQNGKVLVEMVQLFQRYRIIGANDVQLLGDLFEQLLNQGFKQSEGQFFTPLPITRFIWDSLPVEELVAEDGKVHYPRIVDYACGAGHFLTEGFEAVNVALNATGFEVDEEWPRDRLIGIEKDYRLARVSRIALFMHGAGLGDVIYGDGLDNYLEKGVYANAFDVLVANPPYSVSAFKPHLKLRDNELRVAEKVTANGSEIETLFAERAVQLVRPNGIAAIILPGTVLSKTGASFVAAREELLKGFEIKAIVEMGGKTFGATSTNTVILFLRKRNEPPQRIDLVNDTVDAIFEGRVLDDWEDKRLLDAYCKHVGVSVQDYREFVARTRDWRSWETSEHLGMYVRDFLSSPKLKQKESQKGFTKLSELERESWRTNAFYDSAHECERDKLRVFGLIYEQQTLVVSAPTDNAGQKEFLGYEWSNRKGKEGIRIISPGGVLYDSINRRGAGTIAELVRSAFADDPADNPELASLYHWVPLRDMLNFKTVSCSKALRLAGNPLGLLRPPGAYPVATLRHVATYATDHASTMPDPTTYVNTDTMVKERGGIVAYKGSGDVGGVTLYRPGDVLVSNIRPYLKKVWLADRAGSCSPDVLVFHVHDAAELLPSYLYCLLQEDAFFDYAMSTVRGMKMPRADKDQLLEYRIPLLPIEEQRRVVAEFERLSGEIVADEHGIADMRNSVYRKFEELFGEPAGNPMGWPMVSLGSVLSVKPQNGLYKPRSSYVSPPLGTPIVRIDSFNRGFDSNLLKRLMCSVKELACYGLCEGDLLINRVNSIEHMGKTLLVPKLSEPVVFESNMMRFHADVDIVNNRFLYVLLTSAYGKEYFTGHAKRAVNQASINQQDVISLAVPLPPLALQQKFADYVDATESRCAKTEQDLKTLNIARDALVASCFA